LPRRPLPLRNLRRIPRNIDLYVSYVYMRNPDSRRLSRLNNLKGLDACAGSPSNRILEYIGRMKKLRQLKLRFFTVNEDELKHLAELKNLHTLTLAGIKISDRGLAHLGKIRSLRSLKLEDFQPHTYWDYLHWFENLTIFSWRSGQYSERFDYSGFIEELPYQYGSLFVPHTTAEGWRHLAELPYLRELALYHYDVRLTSEDLKGIGSITNLRRLDVGAVGVTDEGLQYLESLTELRDLDLSNNEITDAGVEHLRKLKTLRRLDISYTEVSAEGMARLQRALPECEIICAKRSD
jgi:Leucine-rich repeat (LRR) protein